MKNSVWFTYKARIQAHRRLEWLDFHSQLLLVWYAALGAALAVVSMRVPNVLGEYTDVLSAILSMALLTVSLVISNRGFSARAVRMRRNYLELQKLYREIVDSEPKGKGNDDLDLGLEEKLKTKFRERYNSILDDAENHDDVDDRVARVFSVGLTSRQVGIYDILHVILWIILRHLVVFGLYLLPLIIAFFAWTPNECC